MNWDHTIGGILFLIAPATLPFLDSGFRKEFVEVVKYVRQFLCIRRRNHSQPEGFVMASQAQDHAVSVRDSYEGVANLLSDTLAGEIITEEHFEALLYIGLDHLPIDEVNYWEVVESIRDIVMDREFLVSEDGTIQESMYLITTGGPRVVVHDNGSSIRVNVWWGSDMGSAPFPDDDKARAVFEGCFSGPSRFEPVI